jgi:hypothetical protein
MIPLVVFNEDKKLLSNQSNPTSNIDIRGEAGVCQKRHWRSVGRIFVGPFFKSG